MGQKEFWNDIYNRTFVLHRLFFIISGCFLTYIITLNYSVIISYDGYSGNDYSIDLAYSFLACAIMLPVSIYMAYKKNFVKNLLKSCSACRGWTAFAFSAVITYQLVQDTQKNLSHILIALKQITSDIDWDKNERAVQMLIFVFCALCFWALFIYLVYICGFFIDFFKKMYITSDKGEKLYFVISFLFGLSLICLFYAKSYGQWNTLDQVYQTDASFVYHHYYPVFSFGYDFDWDIGNGGIRHPLATLLTFPVYIAASLLGNLLFFIPNVQAILYAAVNVILMILTVIMLKRMIKSNWIYFIFTISFPFILFTIFVEKYQIATFYIVMFAYAVVNKEEKEVQKYSLFAASGMMITSAFLGFFYGKEKKIRKRLKEYITLFASFLITLIGTGRIRYLLDFTELLNHNFVMFAGKSILSRNISFTPDVFACGAGPLIAGQTATGALAFATERWQELEKGICAFFNLIASCLIPVPYERQINVFNETIFYWKSVKGDLNWFGIGIFVFLLFTFIRHRKEKAVQIFSVWILWGIIQFVIIGFSAGCSPLFSLYFGWAVIPMVMVGLKKLLKNPLSQLLGYGLLGGCIFYTNYLHVANLYQYLVEYMPL